MSEVPTFGIVDDTFDDGAEQSPERAAAVTPLAAIEADLAAETSRPPITLKVRSRRRTALRFDGNISQPALQMWQDRCTTKRGTPQARTDMKKLAAIIIANSCEAVVDVPTGADVVGSDGQVLTFRHPEFLRMLRVQPGEAQQAVYNLFGSDDGALLAMANDVTENAGYTVDGTERVDPTPTGG